MTRYEVWIEGYAATGERGEARLVEAVDAPSFARACALVAEEKHWGSLFNPERLSYWGCRLFDNGFDARHPPAVKSAQRTEIELAYEEWREEIGAESIWVDGPVSALDIFTAGHRAGVASAGRASRR